MPPDEGRYSVAADMDAPFPVAPLVASAIDGATDDGLHRRGRENGYLFLPGLVDPEAIEGLRALCLEAAGRRGWLASPGTDRAAAGVRLLDYEDPAYVEFLRDVVPAAPFTALRRHPAILRAVGAAIGGRARPREADICRVFAAGSPDLTTGPHQDFHYLGGPADGWTAWLPLGDCPMELGPIAVLPGSHKLGPQPHYGARATKCVTGYDPDALWATGPMRAGDAVLFHSLTIHRALPTRADRRLRLSADYRFVPAP